MKLLLPGACLILTSCISVDEYENLVETHMINEDKERQHREYEMHLNAWLQQVKEAHAKHQITEAEYDALMAEYRARGK